MRALVASLLRRTSGRLVALADRLEPPAAAADDDYWDRFIVTVRDEAALLQISATDLALHLMSIRRSTHWQDARTIEIVRKLLANYAELVRRKAAR